MRTLFGIASAVLVATGAFGATLEASPGDNIESMVRNMDAGDTLILHGGTYDIDYLYVANKNGSDSNWTVIRAADGESPAISCSTSRNGIEIVGCSYLHIKGLEIYHADVGVKLKSEGASDHVLLEDLKVHEINDVGISGPGAGHSDITVRGCEVYDTGRAYPTGEGVYISYFGKEVKYLTVENCWIHDLGGSEADGIDIKLGRGCIIRDNVIHNCNYPGIIVRGSSDASEPNLVERNVVWGSNDSGIETYGDCIVRNNIVFGCNNGLHSRDKDGYTLRNVQFINNTVYDCNRCLDIHYWGGKSDMVVANNALYRNSSSERAVYVIGGLGGVTVSGNVYHGSLNLSGAPSDGFTEGNSPGADMLDPSSWDFYPSPASALIDAATSAYAPDIDFNGTSRPFGSVDDVGAYEWTQDGNPGWAIGGGFKEGEIVSGPNADGDDLASPFCGGCGGSVLPDAAAGLAAWALISACWLRARRARI